MTTPQPVPRGGIIPWAVGLFALAQVAVIPLINLFEFLPLRPTPYDVNPPIETAQKWGRFTRHDWLQSSAEEVGYWLAAWGELSGQDQGWNMFTPAFPPNTVVPAVEFRFPDGTSDRSESRFRPRDLARPGPRWPVIHDREFNFEANIVMLGWHADPASLERQPEPGRKLPEKIRENEHLIAAYLRWHWNRYRATNPDHADADEIVLLLHFIPTPAPGEPADWTRRTASELPFARWRPGARPPAGFMAIEGYDPVGKHFVPLAEWPPP